MSHLYLISQLSRICGIPIHTIRYYEKYGLIKGVNKDSKSNNYKYYNDETLEKLELIEEGKSIGLSLSQLKNLIKAWYNQRLTHKSRIEVLRNQMLIIEEKEYKLKDVKARLHLLIKEMEKFA